MRKSNRGHKSAADGIASALVHILDALADGVCVIDAQNDIEYANPALEKQFGPIGGRKCHQYLHRSASVCPDCAYPQVLAGKCVRTQPRLGDGRVYEVFSVALPKAGGTVSLLEVLHQATPERQAQNALTESEKNLRSLSFELLSAQETERRRISKE